MADTELIMRGRTGEHHPLFKPYELRFRVTDGLIVLGLMAAFLGLVLALSK